MHCPKKVTVWSITWATQIKCKIITSNENNFLVLVFAEQLCRPLLVHVNMYDWPLQSVGLSPSSSGLFLITAMLPADVLSLNGITLIKTSPVFSKLFPTSTIWSIFCHFFLEIRNCVLVSHEEFVLNFRGKIWWV